MREPWRRARVLEHAQMPRQIRALISERRLQRIAYAGLRREMQDPGRLRARQRAFQCALFSDIGFDKAKIWKLEKLGKPCALQGRVVIIVDGIYPDDIAPLAEEPPTNMKADETGCTRQEKHNGFRLMNLICPL